MDHSGHMDRMYMSTGQTKQLLCNYGWNVEYGNGGRELIRDFVHFLLLSLTPPKQKQIISNQATYLMMFFDQERPVM